MVSREHIINAALAVDAVISRAFRKALGLLAPMAALRWSATLPLGRSEQREQELLICYANYARPMDGRR